MIEIKPMDESYIHVDCLHNGPVDPAKPPARGPCWTDVGDLPPHPWSDDTIAELAAKYENISHGWRGDAAREFMREMTQRYGSCAILAWWKGRVIGHIRFYPMKMARLVAPGQTDASPVLDCTAACAPEEDEGTVWVQCVMTCRPYENADEARGVGARKGLGLELARALIRWAGEHGWRRIVKVAHCDLDWFYGMQGSGGKAFWEKAGFSAASSFHKRAFELGADHGAIVQSQMAEKGMTQEEVWTWYRMVYELQPAPKGAGGEAMGVVAPE